MATKHLPDYIHQAQARIAAGMTAAKAARILRWSSGYRITQAGAEQLLGA